MNQPVIIASFALALAATSPVGAQCRLCARPSTSVDELSDEGKVTVEIESSLSFDRLVLFGAGEGTAEIRPDGSRFAQGAIADIGPRAMVGTAILHGQPGRIVRVDLPARIELYSMNGGQISFDQVTSDLPAIPRLDASGTLTFRFGGRVRLSGDADGDYRGDLPISAEYQ
jgi:hypothetical protein